MNIQKILRPIVILALFLIPVFALIVDNSFFFPFIAGKGFYFRILVEIAFAGWAILAFLDAKYRPKLSALTIGVTVFALVVLVADLLGVNPIRSIVSNFERMEGWLTIIHLWGLFMVTSSVFGNREEGTRWWHRFFTMSIIVALIVSIYALVQFFGGAAIHQGSTRLDASLGNAAYLAVYMLIHIFLAIYLACVAWGNKIANADFLKWAYPVLAVFFSFILFETATRGTILGLIGGALLTLALYAIFAKNEQSQTGRFVSTGIIVLVIIAGITFWQNRPDHFIKNNQPLNSLATFIQKHDVLNRLATISWEDNKTQARGYIWPMAVKGALERPLFGWGQENFNYVFNSNYSPKMWAQEQWFDRAHNVFLDWLIASGFVGLIAYLALYVLFLFATWKSTLTVAEKSILTGAIIGYAIHNVFVFDNIASYISFFFLLAFANSHYSGKTQIFGGLRTVSKDAAEYIVLPIVIVAFIAAFYFLNIRPIQANTRLIVALNACSSGKVDPALFDETLALDSYMANQEIREQIFSCAGNVIRGQYPGPLKQSIFMLADKAAKDQIAATPKDARIYVLAGSFYNSIGQVQEARPLFEKALELTPRKQSLMLILANIYIGAGENDKALILYKDAYESDVTNIDAKNAYALALIIVGKETDARTLLGDDQSLFSSERLARVYGSIKQYDKAISIYKALVAKDPTNLQTTVALAQLQYAAGMKWQAVETMRSISKAHPEYKDQIEKAIQEAMK